VLALIVIAVVVVVVGVVLVASGHGTRLSVERTDHRPLDLGRVSATDVVLLRPPTGLWGYSMKATDEALEQIAESIRERDVRIVALEQLVSDLSRKDHAALPVAGPPYAGARHRREENDLTEQGTSAARIASGDLIAGAAKDDTAPAENAMTPLPLSIELPEPPDPALPDAPAWAPPAERERSWAQVPASSAELARLPFELPKPNGDGPGTPPEESHD
jgi:hypothetical protein